MDSQKVWIQLNQCLIEVKESHEIDCKHINDSFEAKAKDLNSLVKNTKKSKKDKEKLVLELDSVDRAIKKANSNIAKAEDKIQDIQHYVDKTSKRLDENKENIENVMNVWNTVGLRMDKKDNIFTIKFNRISESDPNKWFSIKMSIEDKKVKVIECDPKESLDSVVVEQEFNVKNQKSRTDLRFLIAFIRNCLKKNNSQ